MGLINYIQTNIPFLNSREGDFIPLNTDSTQKDDTLGPPVVVLYEVPETIDMEELGDMVCDGMPFRTVVDTLMNDDGGSESVVIRRIDGGRDEELLDCTVQDALEKLAQGSGHHDTIQSPSIPTTTTTNSILSSPPPSIITDETCPVLYFSGVTNKEMMDTYNIIANEIYEETNGVHWPACAKVVEPALGKTMRRVLEEISGDHADAMREGRIRDGGEE